METLLHVSASAGYILLFFGLLFGVIVLIGTIKPDQSGIRESKWTVWFRLTIQVSAFVVSPIYAALTVVGWFVTGLKMQTQISLLVAFVCLAYELMT